jgi:2-hydroxyacyl-CoA lyase 1
VCSGPGSAKTGYDVAATALYKLGIRYMFGVIGIPVTQMATAAQAAGIRFISFRNEQAAGYAAAAAGFLTGKPGVLLTVSGPGMVHGIAGLSHAKVNGWPLIMISGSCETSEVGKGAFQELDQCKAASQYVKGSTKALRVQDIPKCLEFAFRSSMSGGFGSSYVDIPSNVFMDNVNDSAEMERILSRIPQDVVPKRSTPVRKKCVNRIYNVMKSSKRYVYESSLK